MRRSLQLLFFLALLAALSACQSLDPSTPATIASLEPVALTIPESRVADAPEQQTPVSLADTIVRYQALLPLLKDPDTRAGIEYRLADLTYRQAEMRFVDDARDEFPAVITAYRELLEKYPGSSRNDRVVYQLARIHSFRGDTEAQMEALDRLVEYYPASELWVEAQFRRAEILFNDGRYAAAGEAYGAVIEATSAADHPQQAFHGNALYMQGWSDFRQGKFWPALLSYARVLDRLQSAAGTSAPLDSDSQVLVDDLYRVMGLSLSYLEGAESVQELFRRVGSKPWEIRLYERYAEQLLDREQYSDAIAVYRAFIDSHPYHELSPRYHSRILEILAEAKFDQQVPASQAAFVEAYGLASDYWRQASVASRVYLRAQLEQLLPELANRHYFQAGQQNDPARQQHHYEQAARYYQAFAETLPSHPDTPAMLFLMAESRLALQQWQAAITAFERVAYDFGAHEQAAEAGYAALLARREQLSRSAEGERKEELARSLQMRRLGFVGRFASDARASTVLYGAVLYEYRQENHPAVVPLAEQLMNWPSEVAPDTVIEVRLLKAHSHYALDEYYQAEMGYQAVLKALAPDDPRWAETENNLAASVYRQAEALLAAGERLAAANEFLRVAQVAPATALAATATLDGANLLLELGFWEQAIAAMERFRVSYPEHELNRSLPAKLALAYREIGQWHNAAAELILVSEHSDDQEEQRETLFMAAELFERAGDTDQAINRYRQYANTWKSPAAVWMEAAAQLAALYESQGEGAKQRYWAQQQVERADALGGQANERIYYLAATASTVLADHARQQFHAIRLTLPLDRTLRAKIDALDTALTAYEKIASYGIPKFSTEAGFQIGELYAHLGKALMDSERPPGLSELERMQYELLLEEQAFPFEDNAIDIHQQNAERSWRGLYDEWVDKSFEALGELVPGRYKKREQATGVIDGLD